MCILVVEDEPLVLLDLAEGLRAEGFEVLTAGDAVTAMGMVAEHPGHFTGLVTDNHMPHGMTGGDLIMHVRAKYPTIPIMLATATLLDLTPEWLEQHQVTLMPKPFASDMLATQFRSQMNSPLL